MGSAESGAPIAITYLIGFRREQAQVNRVLPLLGKREAGRMLEKRSPVTRG